MNLKENKIKLFHLDFSKMIYSMKIKNFVKVCLLIFSFFGYSQEVKLKKANSNYENFQYEDAIVTYEKVAKKGYKSVELFSKLGDSYYVRLAMRYQSPDLATAMADMEAKNLKKLIVIPFFPQYASASTGSVFERVMQLMSKWQVMPSLSIASYFYDHPTFSSYFAAKAANYQKEVDFDYYLFSYHGIPERHVRKGDLTKTTCVFGTCCDSITDKNHGCYRAQCHETTRLIAGKMGLKPGTYSTSFQSRLGRDPWLKPYTDEVIPKLVADGHKKVLAFSPAFVSDCLETTIEVGEEYKEIFEEAGGEHWQLVESLNNSPEWVGLLEDLVKKS